jgi:pyrroloquinoline quinone biosynthesis protein E
MNGWGEVFLSVTPDGLALPCHTARMLPGLDFPMCASTASTGSGTNRPLQPLPRHRLDAGTCQSCEDKDKDHGGCRCQAFMLTGDPGATDPVCPKSPDHALIDAALAEAENPAARARWSSATRRTPPLGRAF